MLIGDVVALIHRWYPPQTAQSWDRVGLAVGDPEQSVRRILLSVDVTREVVQEAVARDCQLIVSHHPLLLRAVSSVAANEPKGRLIHDLITGGVALLCAHTNADIPVGGVSAALAKALGLIDPRPLQVSHEGLEKLTTYVPLAAADQVRQALAEAGAGAIGNYDSCSFSTAGTGRFRPLDGATPAIGELGITEAVDEIRVEAVLRASDRGSVVRSLLAAHPYETPAYDVVSLLNAADPTPESAGLGRVGNLPRELSLREFAELVAEAVPPTAHGVRVAGDPERRIRRVALLGGSGDSHLEMARSSGADVYLTSDLRHHPASEFLETAGPALVDIAHWAAEWTWLPVLAQRLQTHFADGLGRPDPTGGQDRDTVEVVVSTINTDPWTFRL